MRCIKALLLTFLLFSYSLPSHAQGGNAEWIRLNQEIDNLTQQGEYGRAIPVAKEALELAQRNAGPDHPDVANSLSALAEIYSAQGDYTLAVQHHGRALAIREQIHGSDHPDVATSLNYLAELYAALGDYIQAEALNKRALAIQESTLGPDHPSVSTSLNNLAELYIIQGAYAHAEPFHQRALSIRERAFGQDHYVVATSLNNLASLYRAQGDFIQAEKLYRRALAIKEKTWGSEHPDVALSLNNLAGIYKSLGNYADAEPLYKRALAIYEKKLGPDHPDVAISLNNLAILYKIQGAYPQATLLQKRALEIIEKALGPDHPNVALFLNNLAGLYRAQGAYTQAEPLQKRALAIQEKTLGPDHSNVATSLNDLAGLYRLQGAYAQAEPLQKRALAIQEKSLGPDHSDVATSLNNLAGLYQLQGSYDHAEPLFKRAQDIFNKTLGPDHPFVAINLYNLAKIYQLQNRMDEALLFSRSGYRIFRNRFLRASSDSALSQNEKQSIRWNFTNHLGLLAKARQLPQLSNPELLHESFEASQLAQASSTGEVVAKMAARFAAGTDALALKARERQDLVLRLQRFDADLVKAASLDPARRNAALEQQMRNDSVAVTNRLSELDAELAKNFPEYAELASPKPLSIAETQKLLGKEEALLTYTVTDKATYLFVLRADKAELIEIPIGADALSAAVQQLRHRLDPSLNPNLRAFDVNAAHEIYLQVMAPAGPYLAGATHLMLVLDGALQSLPFSVLVSEAPKTPISRPADHRQVAWLAHRYAFTTLPSVSALRALRTFARQEIGKQPFVGFGDPVLEGDAGQKKNLAMSEILTIRNIADVETLRKATRLPETAIELKTMARIMNVGEKQVFLQERATETKVKNLNLSDYRTVAFSTHGVMAGELKGISEPGLVLTPPKMGTALDDGYLSASEIAQLSLKADWVLLSACNTAASDGTPGAEGLAGLAKAFFYAGARSLLVSHWPVDSVATMELQTMLFREYAKRPEAGKAAALRRAMLAAMNSGKNSRYAHPLFWAPFVVAGEGN